MLIVYNFSRAVALEYMKFYGPTWRTSPQYVSIHRLAVNAGVRPEVQGNEPWETPLSRAEREKLLEDAFRTQLPKIIYTCRDKDTAEEIQEFLHQKRIWSTIIDGRIFLDN